MQKHMNKTLKHILTAGVITAGGLGVAGCSITSADVDRFFGGEKKKPKAELIVYNRFIDKNGNHSWSYDEFWIDKNYNGVVDKNEFKGKKTRFRINETMTISTISYGEIGSNLKIKLWNPAHKLTYKNSSTVSVEGEMAMHIFEPFEIMNDIDGGVGRYTVEMYINDILVNVKTFELSR